MDPRQPLIDEFYWEYGEWAGESIRAGQESIALMAEIREQSWDDWELEELTRAVIFDENQIIDWMRGEAERASATCKRLERI